MSGVITSNSFFFENGSIRTKAEYRVLVVPTLSLRRSQVDPIKKWFIEKRYVTQNPKRIRNLEKIENIRFFFIGF